MKSLVLALVLLSTNLQAESIFVEKGKNFEVRLQQAIQEALPGDEVVLDAGRFSLKNEITIETPFITLRGLGKEKTTLFYENDRGGPQAIYITGDGVTIADLAIEDHPADGIKSYGVKGLNLINTKIEWTVKNRAENGSYGFYPVMSSEILIEGNTVIGASDAGIYVGQSRNIIVRNNIAEYNVAGIEIENSTNADVYNNEVRYNTGGILVFDLPDLFVAAGSNTRIYKNHVYENNLENFAASAATVSFVPAGTGILLLAAKNTEISENIVEDHNLASVVLASYYVTSFKTKDKRFNHLVKGTYIHSNSFKRNSLAPYKSGSMLGGLLMALSLPGSVPHIVYDGIGEDELGRAAKYQHKDRDRICIGANETDVSPDKVFAHYDFSSEKWWKPYPGEFADYNLEAFSCEHKKQERIKADYRIKIDPKLAQKIKQSRIKKNYCKNWDKTKGVNFKALMNNDCKDLSDYNLFKHSPEKSLDGIAYAVNTPLFTDYAKKARNFYLPKDKKIKFKDHGTLDFPLGSVLTKPSTMMIILQQKNLQDLWKLGF